MLADTVAVAVARVQQGSPLAEGLMGKKVGEKVEVEVPSGTLRLEITEIQGS